MRSLFYDRVCVPLLDNFFRAERLGANKNRLGLTLTHPGPNNLEMIKLFMFVCI